MRWPLIFLSVPLLAEAHVRTVHPKADDLVQVKTAIGIATIIQLPDAIQTAIIGDQSSFKVEYIDKAVTVKPLRSGARTNLYLMTANERFNLTLVSSSQDQADYVLYIRKNLNLPTIKWTSLVKVTSAAPRTLKTIRIGSTTDGLFIVEGLVDSATEAKIEAKDFWVLQGTNSRAIHSLFISSRTIRKTAPIRWVLSISKADLEKAPMTVTLGGEKALSIEIPETVWR